MVFARKIFGNFCRVKKDILELRKIGRPDPGSGPMSSTIVTTIMTTSVPDDGDGGDGGDDGDDAAVGRWIILMLLLFSHSMMSVSLNTSFLQSPDIFFQGSKLRLQRR